MMLPKCAAGSGDTAKTTDSTKRFNYFEMMKKIKETMTKLEEDKAER